MNVMGVTAKTLHGARICIIPRPENNYLPLALSHGPLAFASSLLIAAKILALLLIALLPSTAELSTITSERIIQLTNAERINRGLNELTSSPALSQAAQDKAKDMLEHDYFAHISPTGVTPWFWMQKYNYTYQVAGENLAIDFVQAEEIVSAWMASPSHKENIIHPDYTETGVAVLTGEYQGGTSTVVVHMFGLPAGASRPTLATGGVVKSSTEPARQLVSPSPTPPSALTQPLPVTPSITSTTDNNIIRGTILLNIKGQPSTSVTILVNNQPRGVIDINPNGEAQRQLDISDLPDGDVVIKAYASNAAGIKSAISDPLIVQKDTTGPDLNKKDLVFLLSPATDQPVAAVYLPVSNFASLSISVDKQNIITLSSPVPRIAGFPLVNSPIQIQASDDVGNSSTIGNISLIPSFYDTRQDSQSTTPQTAARATRQVAFIVALLIIILLSLAIFIRINIQRPKMIIQTCIVLLIATALLFT